MQNYTYEGLGFKNVEHILSPTVPKGNKYYNTLGIKKPRENIGNFMLQELMEYIDRKCNGNLKNLFVCAIAYMMDGGIHLVYNGEKRDANELYVAYLEPTFYIEAAEQQGYRFKSNMEYISEFVNAREPKGMLILQELVSPQVSMYHFRIVHDEESDVCLNNLYQFPSGKKMRDK